ncbi:MAG: tripartite tricarboxylate transporter TctB family protein [Spirochaetales bacterium]|nr:tripartite tricarboxylate transporter TctB family protein [Spirochaetales bacterium]
MSDKKVFRNADFCLGLIFIAVSLLVFSQVIRIKVAESRIFPTISGSVIGIAGLSLCFSSFRQKNFKDITEILPKLKQIVMIAILLVFYPLFSLLGFYTTIFLILISLNIAISYPMNRSKWAFTIVYSTMLSIICYLVFHIVLGLITPTGLLI